MNSLLFKVVGCWPEVAAALHHNIEKGEIYDVHEDDTLSVSSAGNVEPGSVTFPICQRVIDKHILVSENEIRKAMFLLARDEHVIVEGAAGVAMAAMLKKKEEYKGKNVVVLLCGKNIPLELFMDVISKNQM